MEEGVNTLEKVRRISFIEGLRMMASMCVFNTHILSAIYNLIDYKENGFILYTPIFLLKSGGFGVSYFFFISGFGLYISMDNKNRFEIIINIFKRYFRLVPIILFSNLFCWILMKWGLYFIDNGSFLYENYDLNCTVLRPVQEAFWSVFRGEHSFTSTFWTIEPQIKGMILASLLLILELHLSSKIKIMVNLLAMFGVYLFKIDANSYILSLIAGTICYEIFLICTDNAKASSFIKSHSTVLIIFSALMIEIIVLYQQIGNANDYFDYTYLCWVPWIVLFPTLLISDKDPLKQFLENKYLVMLGGYSFAVYGVHEIVWHSLGYMMVNRMGGHLTTIEAILVYIWCWIATIFAAGIITMLNRYIQRNAVDPLFLLFEKYVKTIR